MKAIQIITETLTIPMQKGPDIKNITPPLRDVVNASGINIGTLHIFVSGSTGSVTTIEYEPGVVSDLKRAINSLAPPDLDYAHEKAWHDGNGHSHVQAALIGPSLSIPIRSGRMVLGTWQQIVIINHDNGARQRSVELTLTGI